MNYNKKYFLFALIGSFVIGGIYFGLDQKFGGNNPITVSESENVQIITNYGILELNQNAISENELQDGELGNLFVNLKAGFKIEKPNPKWFFVKDISTYGRTLGLEVPSGYVGGVFVHRINAAQIGVFVEQLSTIKTLDIDEYLERSAIESSKGFNVNLEILDKVVSTDNDYGYIETIFSNSTHQRYDFVIVQKSADKLYTLHVNSFTPEIIPEDVVKEINFVVNSFRIIS